MGSTTVTSDCSLPVNSFQNGMSNGHSRILADTSSMNIEECRLETFKGKWPVQAPIQAERLAKAGFYYTGQDMEVKCFSCGGGIGEWNYGDIAFEKHKRFFGQVCNFISNKSNNIPFTSHGNNKSRTCSEEFSSANRGNKPYITRGSSYEASNVHSISPGVANESNFPLHYEDFEKLAVNNHVGEICPPQNGISSANIRNNYNGAQVTCQESKAVQQPQSKGIFMSGSSGVGARVMYNNQEINRSTLQQPMTSNAKGIFMSGNSGLGASVMYKEFNVHNQPTVENSLNSESNPNSASPSENVNFNGIPAQAMPSTREQFFNQGTSSTSNIFTGTSTQPVQSQLNVNVNGMPAPTMASTREQFFNHGSNSTANPFPGTPIQPGLSNGCIVSSEVQTSLDDGKMRYESERLKSFKPNWPLTFISPYDLARAGFYYLLRGDICKCAFCKGILMNWQVGDIPIREHHRNFPLCPFVMGLDVQNVPSYAGNVEMLRNSASSGHDECGPYSYEMTCNVPERSSRLLQSSNSVEESGGIRHKGPMHASQATIEARLRSFQSWPSWSPIKAERLAEAGFFYIGIRDHTKCFYCDIGLCNWEPGDDPWIEHGRWSKNCAFVLLLKGDEFVNRCQIKPVSSSAEEHRNYSEVEDEEPSPFSLAVDEAMRSSLVQNVLKTKVYPSVLIRKALLRKFQDTGRGVSNVNELSEAVMVEMEESWRNRSLPTTEMQTPVVSNNQPNGSTGMQMKNYTEPTAEVTLEHVKENRLCKICMDQEIEVAFIPCGHQLACRQCALALKDCAICRKPVDRFLRIFLP